MAASDKRHIPAVGADIAVDAGIVRVAPGEDRRPRRAAQRIGDEIIGEGDAVLLHFEDVRHVLNEVQRKVVGEDEDDIWALRPGRQRGCGGEWCGRGRRGRRHVRRWRIALPEFGIARSAGRHQFRTDSRQRPRGPARLGPALHDGPDAIDLQAIARAPAALHESGLPTGRRDLSARPFGRRLRSGNTRTQQDDGGTNNADSHSMCPHVRHSR
jgi:hypothetical protein